MAYEFSDAVALFFRTEETDEPMLFVDLDADSAIYRTKLLFKLDNELLNPMENPIHWNVQVRSAMEAEFVKKIVQLSKMEFIFSENNPKNNQFEKLVSLLKNEINETITERVTPIASKLKRNVNDVMMEAFERGLELMEKEGGE